MATWIEDANGNKCSVEYFGSEEAARAALESLKNCKYCINCSGCSDCSGCSYVRNAKPVESTSGAPKVPIIEDIHKKVYAAATATSESLDMTTWHTCEITHCRAGWVVNLAGEEGKALENFHNTELAAMLIYKASGYEISPVQLYLNNADALRDMKALAEAE